MAVRGLLDGGSVTVCRMRALAVANEMGRGGVSVAVAAAFANSSAASLLAAVLSSTGSGMGLTASHAGVVTIISYKKYKNNEQET